MILLSIKKNKNIAQLLTTSFDTRVQLTTELRAACIFFRQQLSIRSNHHTLLSRYGIIHFGNVITRNNVKKIWVISDPRNSFNVAPIARKHSNCVSLYTAFLKVKFTLNPSVEFLPNSHHLIFSLSSAFDISPSYHKNLWDIFSRASTVVH